MRKLLKITILLALTLAFTAVNGQSEGKINYPDTKKVDQIDEYFGTKVKDPYRWLENDTSKKTEAWVKKQNKVTFNYLEDIPFRDKVNERLTKIWDYPKQSAPFKEESNYFIYRNSGLQDQSVIYKMENLKDDGEVFLNPNKMSESGTVSLTNFEVSDDGQYAAYGISRGGSDWREFFIRDVQTKKDLDDHIKWAKFSGISWYKDGFFYSRYPKPEKGQKLSGVNKNNKVYYHKAGTPQKEDELIYEDPENPQRGFSVQITADDKYMIMYVTESSSGNGLYFKETDASNSDMVKLVTHFDNDYGVVGHFNGKLYIKTDYKAPKYRLIAVDPENPAEENWEEVIPENENVLQSVSAVGHKLIVRYMKDAHTEVKVFDMQGNHEKDLDLPLGTVSGFNGEIDDKITFFTVTSFTTPSTIYKYNIPEDDISLYRKSAIDFDAEKYVTKQIFYESKDGTEVPMFIVHKKGLELDGNNPTLLYGYGGFNVSLTPRFRITMIPWLENGGVYVQANLRGGGEYGEKWHQAGTKMDKKNVFEDFIAAGEYLIDNNYTSSDRLAIQGGSNGGLLVGAVTNMRPELFEVALPAVGVMDMLRYHKFTIGRYWASDYGTSEQSKEMFEYLYSYSPLHNIKEGKKYPAVMATTADHDDRVVPAHSFKYIATLQEKHDGTNPTLIRIETKAGHGAGTPTSKAIEQATDMLSFTWYNMNYTPDFE